MSELIIIQRHPNAKNLYICSGKPDTKEDVQHYYFACRRCGGELKLQPQFWKNVSDGIDIMCWTCAGKEGFDTVHHYNMSISIKSDKLRKDEK
uniref:Uncharacterized protein n=1 Tax=viral metagenome TaxID=1070528 RepID=A0A6M3X4I7_9ZZZZ